MSLSAPPLNRCLLYAVPHMLSFSFPRYYNLPRLTNRKINTHHGAEKN